MKWRIYVQWLLGTVLDHIHERTGEDKFINFELLLAAYCEASTIIYTLLP